MYQLHEQVRTYRLAHVPMSRVEVHALGRLVVAAAVLVLAVSAACHAGDVRTWTDSTGKYQIEAELVAADSESATLRKSDGRGITVPVTRLSDEDRRFLAQQIVAETGPGGVADQPAIVELDLQSDVYRVTVVPQDGRLKDVLCDIGVSRFLREPPPTHPQPRAAADSGNVIVLGEATPDAPSYDDWQIVKANMKPGEKLDIMFKHDVHDARIGMRVEFRRRAKSVMLELRPKFVLPSGSVTALSLTAGNKKIRDLEESFADAEAARFNLPIMHRELDSLIWRYDHAWNDMGPIDGPEGMFRRVRASRDRFVLQGAIRKVRKQIVQAEQLVANQSVVTTDLAAIGGVAEYVRRLQSQAWVCVRIHDSQETLLADQR